MRLSLRARVLLPFVVAMAALLAVVGLLLYLRLQASLGNDLDQGIRQRADDLAGVVTRSAVPLDLETPDLVERGESFAQVLTAGGEVLAGTEGLSSRPLLSGADLAGAGRRTVMLDRRSVPGLDEPARLVALPLRRGDHPVVLVVGATKGNMIETLDVLRNELLVGGSLTLLLASVAGYLLSGAALRPVEAMRRRAEQITASEPDQRLPVSGGDELARLASTLNDMLGRLEAALARERDFVADASHELRTPLALLKTELELALRRPRSKDELRAAIASAAEETDRLTRLAEDLLVLARLDDGRLPVRVEAVPVEDLLRRTVARFAAEAEAQNRRIVVADGSVGSLPGDPARLQQALACLVDNALVHGGGDIDVFTQLDGDRLEVHVADHGSGFPDEFLSRAFERFSRADAARTGGGAGLGLTLALAIAQLHGGTAGAANRSGAGADTWLSLPT
jgi:signal transduction histidine kinase